MAGNIITNNLNRNFRAALSGNPVDPRDVSPDISEIKAKAFADGQKAAAHVIRSNQFQSSAQVSAGPGMAKMASGGVVYTQPQFFSPIHTPINWQIPVKRKEMYQWARFYYENEPKVATAVEFYSKFPINSFTNECSNRHVKRYFDKLTEKLRLLKWLRVISHEVHLLGDCFPFLEVDCEKCQGRGIDNKGQPCDHSGGSFKRLVILNPECAEVYSDPISPESLIAFMPNDELRTLIMKRGPGHDRFSPDIIKMIMAGRPIPLDNRNVSHLKYCDNGYNKYGTGMVRRLFPILAYKTKLMTAQWIIAERLILPIKVAKVGSDERPASAGDLSDINTKLAQVANDPNLTLVTHHAFELDWFGASLADDMQILTEDGWKSRTEMNDGLKVAAYDMTSGKVEFQETLSRPMYRFTGNMVEIKSRHADLLVTPDHKMLFSAYSARDGYGEWQKGKASELPSSFKFAANAMWEGKLPESYGFNSPEIANANIDDVLKLIGYYMSEGYIKIDNGVPRSVSICQNDDNPASLKIKSVMEKLLGHIQVTQDKRTGKNNLQFYAHNTRIAKEFAEILGSHAPAKRLPKWVVNLPVDKLKIVFDAMMEGDGSCRHSPNGYVRYRYSTASALLADQVQEIVLKLGCISAVKHEPSNNKRHHDMFRIYWSKERKKIGVHLKRRHIRNIPYDGMVWCVTVPSGNIVVRRNGKVGIVGNSGKIMQLTNEFEIISQEILDGLGVNKVLLNGEGPTYSSAAIGVEVMIDKLDSWRNELSEWVEQKIYLPVAKMMGFIEENEWGEKEYVYPRIKWDIMHLRDQQQYRTFILQLHEKGAISTQTMLKAFDINYDQEVELLRYERAKGALPGGDQQQQGGMGGGFGGGGGGLPDLGGLGGGAEGGGGMDLGGGGGPEMGGVPAGGGEAGGMAAAASTSVANIHEFGGKVLKKKSRDKVTRFKERLFSNQHKDEESGYLRDDKGRIQFTGPERSLLKELSASVKRGELRHNIVAQLPVKAMGEEYSLDFAMPDLKLGIEVDGALFHSTDEQIASDKRRDSRLAQQGWTILRFTDKEVENKTRQVIETIIKSQIQKENWMKENAPQ